MSRNAILPQKRIGNPERLSFTRRCPVCAANHDASELRKGRCLKCGAPFQEAKDEDLLPFVVVTARGATYNLRARSTQQVEMVLRSKGFPYQSVKKATATQKAKKPARSK